MNAIKFLIKEHNRFKKTFSKVDNSEPDTTFQRRQRLFDKLCVELEVHEAMEETVWYPILRNELKVKSLINNLMREEKAAAKKIKSFKLVKNQEEWEKKVIELRDDIIQHATEEESELFPRVWVDLDIKKLSQLGEKMENFRNKKLKKKMRELSKESTNKMMNY